MVAVGDAKATALGIRAAHLPSGAGFAPASPRQVDEALWKQNCIDLHQVMTVVRSVYLVLEHSNEALLRVAVELVTCPVARKILWWNDSWSGDFQKREYLKELIREKLALAIAHAKNTKPVFEEEEKETVSPEELEELRRQMQQAESAKKAAQHQQQVAELRCREVEEKAAEDRKQVEALEASLNQLRAQLRAAMDVKVADPELEAKLAELEAKLKASEQQCGMLTEKVGGLEGKVKASEDALSNALKASESMQAEIKRLMSLPPPPPPVKPPEPPKEIVKEVIPKKLLEEHRREVEALKAQLEEALNAAKKAQQEGAEASSALEKMRSEVEAARRRADEAEARAAAAQQPREQPKKKEPPKPPPPVQPPPQVDTSKWEEKIKSLMAELEEEKRRTKAAEQRAEELAKRPPPAPPPPPPAPEPKKETPRPPPPPVDTGLSKEQLEELEALRKITAEHEKALGKLASKDQRIAVLKEEKAALEEEKLRMLKMLQQLKEQLRRVQEIAEKKGYGKLVQEILEEAQVTDTINSPEFSCFDRLYEDALRRQRKHRELLVARGVSVAERYRPRGNFGHRQVASGVGRVGEDFVGEMHEEQPLLSATWTGALQPGSPQPTGHYRHHSSGILTNCPCIQCGFDPRSGAGVPAGGGALGGYVSRASSPSPQAGRGLSAGAGSVRSPGDVEAQLTPQQSAAALGFKEAGQPKTPAVLADLARPSAAAHLGKLTAADPQSPLPMASSASSPALGAVRYALSPNGVPDAGMRGRSRSPMNMLLPQRTRGGAANQALLHLVHSRSEAKETLPAVHHGLERQTSHVHVITLQLLGRGKAIHRGIAARS
mmetsp:Transcript_96649/g.288612  ORF Transcript_96649/g.288612 Transcript_96649/m.288612 type:complete len:835 (+) Transcript_96649:86-2590(+)